MSKVSQLPDGTRTYRCRRNGEWLAWFFNPLTRRRTEGFGRTEAKALANLKMKLESKS